MSDPTEPTEPAEKAAAKKAPAKKTTSSTSSTSKAPASRSTAAKKTPAKKAPAKKAAGTTKVAASKGEPKDKAKDKPVKERSGPLSRLRRDRDHDDALGEIKREPVLTPRTILAIVLFVAGVAWIAYYYIGVRTVDEFGIAGDPTGPAFMGDLGQWNYLIGFGAIGLSLIVAAHPSTPLGRGRGVVVGMLGCFGVGLLWICTFYVISGADYYRDVPVFNDLEQKNLIVGIGLMAMGFVFATKWE